MVIHFESLGNFNSGIPTLRALMSKRSRVTIQLSEDKLAFQSEIDKILYEVKLSEINTFYIKSRLRILVIELVDMQGNIYTFYPLLKKNDKHFYSKELTEELFRHITRLYVKKEMPILFETKGAFWEGTPQEYNWKLKYSEGIILLTENFISYKSLQDEKFDHIKVLDIIEINTQAQSSNNSFIQVITKQNQSYTLIPLKRSFKRLVKDKVKADKFLELLNQVKSYKASEQIRLIELEKERIKKVKSMMHVSNRISLEMMRQALDMDQKLFSNKIFDWAKKFTFIIDGDFLIVNKDNLNEFLFALSENQDAKKIKCSFCGNEVDIQAKICPLCGKELKIG